MKIQRANSYKQNPSFGVIRIPVKECSPSLGYKELDNIFDKYAPHNTIKVNRGRTPSGKTFNYIMTEPSLVETNIFKDIYALCKKVKLVKGENFKKNLKCYKEYMAELANDEDRIFVPRDEYTENTLRLLNSHFEEQIEPTNSGPRWSEYQLKQFFENIKKQTPVDDPVMEKIRTTFKIFKMQKVQENSYLGGMLNDSTRNPKDVAAALKALKKAGIDTVIDFTYENKDYEKSCLDAGLKYYRTDVGNACIADGKFAKEKMAFHSLEEVAEHLQIKFPAKQIPEIYQENTRKFVDDFVNVIELFQKGNFFAGCTDVMMRTRKILELNYIFNPKAENKFIKIEYIHFSNEELQNLYKNLTAADKRRMNYTPEFEEQLREKLEIK